MNRESTVNPAPHTALLREGILISQPWTLSAVCCSHPKQTFNKFNSTGKVTLPLYQSCNLSYFRKLCCSGKPLMGKAEIVPPFQHSLCCVWLSSYTVGTAFLASWWAFFSTKGSPLCSSQVFVSRPAAVNAFGASAFGAGELSDLDLIHTPVILHNCYYPSARMCTKPAHVSIESRCLISCMLTAGFAESKHAIIVTHP